MLCSRNCRGKSTCTEVDDFFPIWMNENDAKLFFKLNNYIKSKPEIARNGFNECCILDRKVPIYKFLHVE